MDPSIYPSVNPLQDQWVNNLLLPHGRSCTTPDRVQSCSDVNVLSSVAVFMSQNVPDLFHPFSCIKRTTQLLRTAVFHPVRHETLEGIYHLWVIRVTRKPLAWLTNLLKSQGFTQEDAILLTDVQTHCSVPSHTTPKLYEVHVCCWPVGTRDC